jgi:RNA polymerase sigma-70 factor (ECF subfamily)
MGHPQNNSLYFPGIGLRNFGFCGNVGNSSTLIIGETKSQETARPILDIARLSRQMAKGDEEAYCEFHHAYFNRLLAYLLVVTQDEQLAREALQTTLLRVARHAKKFDSEDAFWSWLTVLARSSVADERRRSGRYGSFLERFFHRNSIEREEQANENYSHLKELLEVNLQALPPEDREVLERKYFEGESVRQIAQATQLSEKAVESRLVRIRQKLKALVLSQLTHEA